MVLNSPRDDQICHLSLRLDVLDRITNVSGGLRLTVVVLEAYLLEIGLHKREPLLDTTLDISSTFAYISHN